MREDEELTKNIPYLDLPANYGVSYISILCTNDRDKRDLAIARIPGISVHSKYGTRSTHTYSSITWMMGTENHETKITKKVIETVSNAAWKGFSLEAKLDSHIPDKIWRSREFLRMIACFAQFPHDLFIWEKSWVLYAWRTPSKYMWSLSTDV